MAGIIIIGAGGHARSVMDSIDYEYFELKGFVDENKTGLFCDRRIYGSIEAVPNYRDCFFHIAIGDCFDRFRWFRIINNLNLKMVNIIDRTALISPSVVMGKGNYVGKYAVVNADTVIGDNNLINTKALLEHGCRIGSHTNISTCSVLNGDVKVQDLAYVGSTAVVNGQIRIGQGSVIGSGAVVTRNVASGATVVGIPAREIKREAHECSDICTSSR